MTDAVEVTLRPVGFGAGEVTSRLVQAATAAGYRVAPTSPGTFLLARSVRPRWATAAGILTLGIGFPFFFVKRQESCRLAIDEDREGLRARLAGSLDPAALAALRAACGVTEPAPSGPVSFRPPADAAPVASRWTPPTLLDAAVDSASVDSASVDSVSVNVGAVMEDRTVRRASAAERFVLVLPDGRREPLADGVMVIGRDPTSPGAERLLAIDDRSLSRNHLRLECRAGILQAIDLGSTNGSRVVRPGGRIDELTAGLPAHLEPGVILELGERRVRIEREERP